jgi:hypothetical protein
VNDEDLHELATFDGHVERKWDENLKSKRNLNVCLFVFCEKEEKVFE